MGLADADHVEKERCGKDGPSASDQAERKADQRAAADSEEILTLDGEDLRPLPLSLRKTNLARLRNHLKLLFEAAARAAT